MRRRRPGRGTVRPSISRSRAPPDRSQGDVAARDHEVRLAHAEDVDELAGGLEASAVGPVINDILGECLGEARHEGELVYSRRIEARADDRCAAGGALGEWDLDLLAILEPASEVGEPGRISFGCEAACGGYRVVNTIPSRQPIQARASNGPDNVDEKSGW